MLPIWRRYSPRAWSAATPSPPTERVGARSSSPSGRGTDLCCSVGLVPASPRPCRPRREPTDSLREWREGAVVRLCCCLIGCSFVCLLGRLSGRRGRTRRARSADVLLWFAWPPGWGMVAACCRILSPFLTPAATAPRDSASADFLRNTVPDSNKLKRSTARSRHDNRKSRGCCAAVAKGVRARVAVRVPLPCPAAMILSARVAGHFGEVDNPPDATGRDVLVEYQRGRRFRRNQLLGTSTSRMRTFSTRPPWRSTVWTVLAFGIARVRTAPARK